jgi:hypothetical protein
MNVPVDYNRLAERRINLLQLRIVSFRPRVRDLKVMK